MDDDDATILAAVVAIDQQPWWFFAGHRRQSYFDATEGSPQFGGSLSLRSGLPQNGVKATSWFGSLRSGHAREAILSSSSVVRLGSRQHHMVGALELVGLPTGRDGDVKGPLQALQGGSVWLT